MRWKQGWFTLDLGVCMLIVSLTCLPGSLSPRGQGRNLKYKLMLRAKTSLRVKTTKRRSEFSSWKALAPSYEQDPESHPSA